MKHKEVTMRKWIEKFEKIFAAVAFAEVGCHDTALQMVDDRIDRKQKMSLSCFLENVGLNHVRVCYVTAKI